MNIFNFFRKKVEKDELSIFHSYSRSRSYSTIQKRKRTTMQNFLDRARGNDSDYNYGFINTYFNGVHYPVHDLDNEIKYQTFLKEMVDEQYVIFRSSKSEDNGNRYWAIVDEEVLNIKKYKNTNWHIINDTNYVNVTKKEKEFCIRFTFKNMNRKPVRIIKTNDVSENFKKFILTFEELLNEDAIELSALIYKDKEVLSMYNRIKKLERIIN